MVEITGVRFGEIEIDKKIYYSDMIVWWDGKVEFRTKSHVFDINEFLKISEKKPELIVIGTGISGIIRIEEEVLQVAEEKGIDIYTEISEKAADMFNAFIADKKRVVAVLHSTC